MAAVVSGCQPLKSFGNTRGAWRRPECTTGGFAETGLRRNGRRVAVAAHRGRWAARWLGKGTWSKRWASNVRGLLAVLSMLAVAAAIIAGFKGIVRLDEASEVRLELREMGYLVCGVEKWESPTTSDADGGPLGVPAGSRLYRVTFRPKPTAPCEEAYRVVGAATANSWHFAGRP